MADQPRRGDVAFLDGKTRIVLTAVMTQANGDVWVEYHSPPNPRGWMSAREYLARTRVAEGEWVCVGSRAKSSKPRVAHFVRPGSDTRSSLCFRLIVNPEPAPDGLARCISCQQRRRCAPIPGDQPCPTENSIMKIYSLTSSSFQS